MCFKNINITPLGNDTKTCASYIARSPHKVFDPEVILKSPQEILFKTSSRAYLDFDYLMAFLPLRSSLKNRVKDASGRDILCHRWVQKWRVVCNILICCELPHLIAQTDANSCELAPSQRLLQKGV